MNLLFIRKTIIWYVLTVIFFIGILLNPFVGICAENKTSKVIIETNMGNIALVLFENEAPLTVTNFLRYVDEGFYNGTIFHRVASGFVIQGGGFDEQMTRAQTYDPIVNESNNGISNDTYTIAMARTTAPDSATSQFFINLVDNKFLNYSAMSTGYAVFGQVVEGSAVVDAIGAVATTTLDYYEGFPIEPVIIQKIVRIDALPIATEIKANGSDGPISITTTDNLSIEIQLAPGGYAGDNADWWLVAATPSGLLHYQLDIGLFVPDLKYSHQGSLFNLGGFEVQNISLPLGESTLYFGVDMDMNGVLDIDKAYYDSVTVNIQ